MKTAILATLPLALALVPASGAATVEHQIELHEFAGGAMHLYPDEIRAKVGDTLHVTVANPGTNQLDHNVVFCGEAPKPGNECGRRLAFTPMIPPNGTSALTLTLTEAGTFEFWCEVLGHKGATPGMKGTLIVEGEPQKETPLGALAVAGGALAAAALLRRR